MTANRTDLPSPAAEGNRASASNEPRAPARTLDASRQGQAEGRGPGEWIVLALILLAGLLLRGLYLRELVNKPDFTVPAVDAGFHDYWARALATGDWRTRFGLPDPLIRQTAYLRPPGYPYFLALIYSVCGGGYLAPRVVQMALGLVNAALGYVFARRWFGRDTGLVLAALMTTYWIFIYFEGEFHAPVLAIYLLWLMVYTAGVWTERLQARYAFGAGLLLGITALVLPNVLVFLPVLVGWFWWVARRVFSQTALGLVLGTALAVAPSAIRNYLVTGDFVLISSNAGINLYIGNNENATGGVADRIAGLGDFKTCYDYPALAANLERKLGKPLQPSEVSRYFTGEAWRFIREHPVQSLKLTAKKVLFFWGPHEVMHNKVVRYEREVSPVLRNIPGNFSLVFSLAAVGTVLLLIDRRRGRPGGTVPEPCVKMVPGPCSMSGVSLLSEQWHGDAAWKIVVLLWSLILAFFLSVLPFFAAARYRVPIIPFLLVFAAYGLCRLGGSLAARMVKWVIGWLGAGAALYAAHTLAETLVPEGRWDLAKWHYDRAVAYSLTGRTEPAVDEYRAVLERMPQNPHAHLGLGMGLAKRGALGEAVEHFHEALRLWPEYAEAHFNLGVVAEAQGHLDEAIAHYTQAVRYHPAYVEAHYNLGVLLAAKGRQDEAAAHYLQTLCVRPDFALAHTNLAVVLFQQRRLDEAESHFREVVRLEPYNPEARCNLAIVLTHQGRFAEAAREYQTALRIAPQHPTARAALAELIELARPSNSSPPP